MVDSRFFNRFRKKDINNQLYNDYSIKNDSNVRFDDNTVTPPRVVYSKFGSPPYLNSNTDFVSKFKSLGNWQKEVPLPKTKPVFDKISLDMQENSQSRPRTNSADFILPQSQKEQLVRNPAEIKADEFRRNKLLRDGFTSFQKNRNLNLENAKKRKEIRLQIEEELKNSPRYIEAMEQERKFREDQQREQEENETRSKARDFSYLTRNAAYKYSQNNLREPFQRWKEQVRLEKEAEKAKEAEGRAKAIKLDRTYGGSLLLDKFSNKYNKEGLLEGFRKLKENVVQQRPLKIEGVPGGVSGKINYPLYEEESFGEVENPDVTNNQSLTNINLPVTNIGDINKPLTSQEKMVKEAELEYVINWYNKRLRNMQNGYAFAHEKGYPWLLLQTLEHHVNPIKLELGQAPIIPDFNEQSDLASIKPLKYK